MKLRSPSEHLGSLVGERHSAIRQSFDKLLDALAQNDVSAVSAANAALLVDLNRLGDVVAREHWPSWLVDLIGNCSNYATNHRNGLATWRAHLLSLVDNKARLEQHQWFQESVDENIFNIDQIVSEARSQFQIDELFDKIILTLRALSNCDELDSVKACNDLEKIISILKEARSGSFLSQVVSWQFARRFLPNLISQYAKQSAIIGPIIEAFEQTALELDVNLDKAKDKIGHALIEHAAGSLKSSAILGMSPKDIRALPNFSD